MAKKQVSIGCLFWIALVLLVFVILLFNWKQINTVFHSTGMDKFVNNLFKKELLSPQTEGKQTSPPGLPEQQPGGNPESQPPPPLVQRDSTPTATPITLQPTEITIEISNPTVIPPAQTTEAEDYKIRNANLYFTRIDNEGRISFVPVKREVHYADSPLKSTILSLMKGPSHQELNSGMLNLIPGETELKNIFVKGNTAFLDFNENFRFNSLGKEGMRAQLQQIVFTSTEFINVHTVQILIEGKVVDYMGPEGVFIGQPLSRKDFQAG